MAEQAAGGQAGGSGGGGDTGGAGGGTSSPSTASPSPSSPSTASPGPGPAPKSTAGAPEGGRDRGSDGRFSSGKRPHLPGVTPDRDLSKGDDDFGGPVVQKFTTIKPIPPKKDGGDGKPEKPGEKPGEKPAPVAAAGQKPVVPGAPAPGTPPPAASTPQQFKFMGRDWKSQQEAEHHVRSLQGQFKDMNTLKVEAVTNRQAAEAWKHRSETIERQLSEHGLKLDPQTGQLGRGEKEAGAAGTAGPVPGGNGGATPSQSPLDGVDLKLFKSIVDRDGLDVASVWLTETIAKNQEKRFEDKLQQAIKPFQHQMLQQQVTQHVGGVVDQLRRTTEVDASGRNVPAYPELHDPEASRMIGDVWRTIGFDDKYRMTPAALHIATLLYRDFRKKYQQSMAPRSTPTPPSGSPEAAAQQIVQEMIGGSDDQSALQEGPPHRRQSPNGAESLDDQIRRELREASAINPVTGFSR